MTQKNVWSRKQVTTERRAMRRMKKRERRTMRMT